MNYAKDQSVVPADASCSGPSQHLGSKHDSTIEINGTHLVAHAKI